MLVLVTNAVDGERFLLNTAFIRSFHPARNPQFPTAKTVAICQGEGEGEFWLTECVIAIDCMSRGELPPLDVVGMRQKIEAAIEERKARSAEPSSAIWPK